MSEPLFKKEGLSLLQPRLTARDLLIYSHIRKDPIIKSFLWLIDGEDKDTYELAQEEARLFASLAESVEGSTEPMVENAWKNHLLNLILESENIFSLKAELNGLSNMGSSLKKAVENDLRCLQTLFNVDLNMFFKGRCFPLDGFKDSSKGQGDELMNLRLNMKRALANWKDWGLHIEDLAEYYRRVGSGIFGKYLAFRWVEGYLEGIDEPDPTRLEDLIGYEAQRNEVINNTEQFVRGYPANNMLLYGDRGTGKSSTVKALIYRFGGTGLRLVEVSQEDLKDFPQILKGLRKRAGRFILFIDDLSFDEGEREYKALKAVLEGGIEVQPPNILIYATSNRRHLVKERFSDSQDTSFRKIPGEDGEIHVEDTVQEKLSLSDRFGLTVTFLSPNQEGYLRIVEGLAEQRGLEISLEELRRRALQWELWHNVRSGRTARQFIDQLEGELALKNQ